MFDFSLLKSDELAVFKLRALYKSYGYLPFKMSKFEDYDLYARNKDFLVSDRVITFNDTDGRLLALKPDVTLSIIKNTKNNADMQKVYYNENVYRVSGSTGQFKELMQTGIECIGNIDIADIFEVVLLASRSLATVSDDYVLDISHMGVVTAALSEATADKALKKHIMQLIAEKNAHEISEICRQNGISEEKANVLVALSGMYGDRNSVLEKLTLICPESAHPALSELRELDSLLTASGIGDRVRFDFSVVNNMKYYNGIVFKGFLSGICEGVLAGGEYDNLLESMRISSRGIGFALYLDLLAELDGASSEYDVDVLLLYSVSCSAEKLSSKKAELIAEGKSVYSSTLLPEKLTYREIVTLD